jgi:predicted transposase YbfD/YdcC
MSMLDKHNLQTLLECLAIVPDPRVKRRRLHKLIDILFLTLCALFSGCDTWQEIYEFGIIKEDWLKKYIDLENGVPSPDTIARVLSIIDPKKMNQVFSEIIKRFFKFDDERKIVAIDGKRLRGSQTENSTGVHMVGAFSIEQGISLGQVAVSKKENEIKAIPELLDILTLEKCTVTMDAIGCQREIIQKIMEKGGDYVIALKRNQPNLYSDVKLFFDYRMENGFKEKNFDVFGTFDKCHGRVESRKYWITGDVSWLPDLGKWPGLKSIGRVECQRTCRGKTTCDVRYFICSTEINAERFAQAVRGHWAIENKLHWRLDIGFSEDKIRIRARNAAQNLAILRRMILNIIKMESPAKKTSVRLKRIKAGWSNEYLMGLLALFFQESAQPVNSS